MDCFVTIELCLHLCDIKFFSLFLVFRLKYSTPEKPLVVIATTQIGELRSFEERESGLWIGAMTKMSSLENKMMMLLEKLPGINSICCSNSTCMYHEPVYTVCGLKNGSGRG